MDVERMRGYLLGLPHVEETMQWGENLVFWVGDKAIGGKMFALIDLDEPNPSSQWHAAAAARPTRVSMESESELESTRRSGRQSSLRPATEKLQLLISYSAGPVRYSELLEREGLHPAPYMARIHWVAAERWDVFSDAEWHSELRAAYEITLAKMPPKTRRILALPAAEQRRQS
jgi:predicted DNA-binding protein (MmcQ/YjbR family)